MDFIEMAKTVQKYHNGIVDKCIRAVLSLHDEKMDIPFGDFDSEDTGYYKALNDSEAKLKKLKMKDSEREEVV